MNPYEDIALTWLYNAKEGRTPFMQEFMYYFLPSDGIATALKYVRSQIAHALVYGAGSVYISGQKPVVHMPGFITVFDRPPTEADDWPVVMNVEMRMIQTRYKEPYHQALRITALVGIEGWQPGMDFTTGQYEENRQTASSASGG